MWFRGVVASMGLCLDLGAVLKEAAKLRAADEYKKIAELTPANFKKLDASCPERG